MSIQLLTQFVNRRIDFVTIQKNSFVETGKTPVKTIIFPSSVQNDIMLCRDKRNRKAPVVLSTDASISFHRIHDTTSSPGHGWDILGHTRTFQDILGHSWTFSDETSLLEATCKWKSQSVDSEIMTNRWKTGNGVI